MVIVRGRLSRQGSRDGDRGGTGEAAGLPHRAGPALPGLPV